MKNTTIKASERRVIKESVKFRKVWVDTGKKNKNGHKIFRSLGNGKRRAFTEEER